MKAASSGCLKWLGNVERLMSAMRKAKVEIVTQMDGVVLENTKKNKVLCVAYSLERALDARPPQEVAKAVIDRLKLLRHAPRVNKAGCATLATKLIDGARSFAAKDATSAAKVTVDLPPLPKRDTATVEKREQEYKKWTGAPPAELANVHLRMPFDSHTLGATAPFQKGPKLRGRPTIVGGIELATIKPMDVLVKKLAHGEKSEKAKKRKRGGDDSEEEEEESGDEESG